MENNKKSVLFIQGGIGISGISKALVSILSVWDLSLYEVDLLLIDSVGVLRPYIPNGVHIIVDKRSRLLSLGIAGLFPILRSGRVDWFLLSVFRLFISWINRPTGAWILSRFFPQIEKQYDLIVDWQGQQQLYYMVDRLKGKVKVSVFHSDYHKWPYYYCFDKKYYPKLDKIFSISEECVLSLKEMFPDCKEKIHLLQNITSANNIIKMSEELAPDLSYEYPIIISLGHVSEEKGCHWSIKAASLLKKRGIRFNWYFIGKVLNPTLFYGLIRQYEVEDCVHFLGIQVNPYKFMTKATIIVHASKFEGKSVALDEAKLLCKPIVATNFSTVYDQFEDRKNATICCMNEASLADAIEELIKNVELRQFYIDNLKEHMVDNSSEVIKLYNILE